MLKKKSDIPDFPHLLNNCGWVMVIQSDFLGETYSSTSDSLPLELNRDTNVMTSHPPNTDRVLVEGIFNCLLLLFDFLADDSTDSSLLKNCSSLNSWYVLPGFFGLLLLFGWKVFAVSSIDRTGADRARINGRRVVFDDCIPLHWNWARLASAVSLYDASTSLHCIFSGFYYKKCFSKLPIFEYLKLYRTKFGIKVSLSLSDSLNASGFVLILWLRKMFIFTRSSRLYDILFWRSRFLAL